MQRKIDFVFFDAGGGHRAAANALQTVIQREHYPWQIRLVNFQETLDHLDIFRKLTGVRLQDIYNLLLKKGWTLGSPQLLAMMHRIIRIYHPPLVTELKKFWSQSHPDLVVSPIPNFARPLYESLKAIHPNIPLVTILTDLADYPPHFWMEPAQEQFWVCGSERAVEQAAAMGYGPDRVFRVSGMILNPAFYDPISVDRAAERRLLHLDPARPTGLLLFGGQGSKVMYSILERLSKEAAPAQYIAICGKNEALRERIRAHRWPMPVHAEGFTTQVPSYMHISDFLIGKPGPGSLSEAVHMRLPAIVERNAWTLPQERYNADWLLANQAGIVLQSFDQISAGVRQLLAGDVLQRYRANTEKLNNRAVFEIPPILNNLLGGS